MVADLEIPYEKEELKQKIMDFVIRFYKEGRVLSLTHLAEAVGETPYRIIRYVVELEIEKKIKTIKHNKLWIILPYFDPEEIERLRKELEECKRKIKQEK